MNLCRLSQHRFRPRILFSLFAALALHCGTIFASPLLQELPKFPTPPNTTSNWIAKNVVVNNTPMSFKEFIYPGSKGQFEGFYQQQWPGPFFNKTHYGEETLLGYVKKPYYYSIRFKERLGRITGQMIISKVEAQTQQRLSTQLPLPMGSTIKQIIHAKDAGKLSESITVTNRLSKNGNARYMLMELGHLGWRTRGGSQNIDKMGGIRTIQLELEKHSSLIQITLSEKQSPIDQSTQMLIHWVK